MKKSTVYVLIVAKIVSLCSCMENNEDLDSSVSMEEATSGTVLYETEQRCDQDL